MKIGIFISADTNSGGIYQYTTSVLQALHGWDSDHEFVIIRFQENQLPLDEFSGPGWSTVMIDPRMAQSRNVWRSLSGDGLDLQDRGLNPEMESFLRSRGVELLLFPAPSQFCFEWGLPYILSIHDLQHRLQPEFPEVSAGRIWKSREYLFRNGVRHAEAVIVDSEVGKQDVLNFYGKHTSPDRIAALPFLPFYRPGDKTFTDTEKQRIRAKYNLPADYLFYPANFWLHKNHARLIHAVHILRSVHKIDTPLVLVGSKSGEQEGRELVFENTMRLAEQLGVKDLVHYLGYVSDEEIPYLYAMARALTMPTFFGPTNIPFLEAWSFGCPVMTSDIRGIREQVESAGLLVDPQDSAAMAEGIVKFWGDDRACKQLIEAGYAKVESYTSTDFAGKLHRIIERTIAKQLETESAPSKPAKPDNGYLVSAIVSTYNAERFIRGCLEDLEAQTIADQLEIIVIDSCSEQNEKAVVEEMQQQYDNIVYIRTEERETVYKAWNRGIKAAGGKYITNANTDDRHAATAFERMAHVLETRPEIALVYADAIITKTPNQTFADHTQTGLFRWRDWNREDLINKGCFIGPQPMWRHSVHTEYGYFDDTFATSGDYEFWLRISQTNDFFHLNTPLGLYLERADSIEHASAARRAKEDERILEMYRQAAADSRIIERLPTVIQPEIPCETGPMANAKTNASVAKTATQQGENTMTQSAPASYSAETEAALIAYMEEKLLGPVNAAVIHNDLGIMYCHTGDHPKALDNFMKATDLDPANSEYLKNLADFHYSIRQDNRAALAVYKRLVTLDPVNITVLTIIGHIHLAEKQLGEAKTYYQRILDLEPDNVEIRGYLENMKTAGGPPTAAGPTDSPEVLYSQAQKLVEQGDFAAAIGQLEALVAADSDHALAHNDLGVLYYQTGNKEKSITAYERALALEPHNLTFKKNLADFKCIELKQVEAALEIYNEILAVEPDDLETLLAMGQVCAMLGRKEDARHFFNQALAIEPWNAEIKQLVEDVEAGQQASDAEPPAEEMYAQATALVENGETAEALAKLEELAAIHPDLAVVQNDLGVLYYQTGDMPAAARHYEKAVEIEPENAVFRKNLADFYCVAQGRLEEGMQIYVDLLAAEPDDVEVLTALGQICQRLEKPEDAHKFYEMALNVEPWNAQIRQLMDEMKYAG